MGGAGLRFSPLRGTTLFARCSNAARTCLRHGQPVSQVTGVRRKAMSPPDALASAPDRVPEPHLATSAGWAQRLLSTVWRHPSRPGLPAALVLCSEHTRGFLALLKTDLGKCFLAPRRGS